jgi:hypothetical protein
MTKTKLTLTDVGALLLSRLGSPILNLDYVLGPVVQKIKPLDWETFWERQVTGKMPLKVN